MITIQREKELRATIRQQKSQGKRIGFVPTMGNLHDGHIALVKQALSICDYVVTSIFVNPLQFGANEDLDKYPRTLEADKDRLVQAGNHALFLPKTDQIYPEGLDQHTKVVVPSLTQDHCGASRPGHFDGVTTVVSILFNMVQPDVAVFGQKDFQQLAVIRKMAQDLHMPVTVEGHPTVREEDGLAMSSRNGYLDASQRKVATFLYQTLQQTADKLQNSFSSKPVNEDFAQLETDARAKLTEAGFRPDYYNIVASNTLRPATADDKEITILAAAYLGTTRLIDNISITL
ncbi:pantoate--beta-alanine ligase [Hahella sp. CCB-MM4]|uniref:pantoate--beta-alanine ligase n=1 Tax=Hahella sp. (strain CCB-MM4) TaxID=1926491 RepID=UPI000B9BE1C3|nr:pantoate--beta-alanine ligase [Hahella sp. CCB-MM4]OZG70056.1 pantoate--beta-alanine ligase [Hahella sp. CCB-MM4]